MKGDFIGKYTSSAACKIEPYGAVGGIRAIRDKNLISNSQTVHPEIQGSTSLKIELTGSQ